jgi:hypothetical protein
MEVMDTSLDKFYTKVCHHGLQIPEDILGKVAFAVSFPLLFHYTQMHVPSLNTHVHKCILNNSEAAAVRVRACQDPDVRILQPWTSRRFSSLYGVMLNHL